MGRLNETSCRWLKYLSTVPPIVLIFFTIDWFRSGSARSVTEKSLTIEALMIIAFVVSNGTVRWSVSRFAIISSVLKLPGSVGFSEIGTNLPKAVYSPSRKFES